MTNVEQGGEDPAKHARALEKNKRELEEARQFFIDGCVDYEDMPTGSRLISVPLGNKRLCPGWQIAPETGERIDSFGEILKRAKKYLSDPVALDRALRLEKHDFLGDRTLLDAINGDDPALRDSALELLYQTDEGQGF